MKVTAKFDNTKHNISLNHQKQLIKLRYNPFVDHVLEFHMLMASRFSQMHHTVGTENAYDPVMSDA